MKIIVLLVTLLITQLSYANTLQLVEELLEKKEIESAEQAFSALSEQQKSALKGQILSGRILLLKDQSEEAYEVFSALCEKHSEEVEVNYQFAVSAVIMAQKASIFSKMGYASDFIEAMEKTLSLKPDHIKAIEYLIGFHLKAPSIAGGDKEKALSFANQLKALDEARGYNQLANAYFQMEKEQQAFDTVTQGLKKFPENDQLYFSRALALITKEQWPLAKEDLKKTVQFTKKEKTKALALYQQGKVSVKSGQDIEEGIRALEAAEPIISDDYKPWVNYRLAQLYIKIKDYEQAQEIVSNISYKKDNKLKQKVKKLKKKLKKLT